MKPLNEVLKKNLKDPEFKRLYEIEQKLTNDICKVFNYLKQANHPVKRGDLMEHFGFTKHQIRVILEELLELNKITTEGSRNGTRYKVSGD